MVDAMSCRICTPIRSGMTYQLNKIWIELIVVKSNQCTKHIINGRNSMGKLLSLSIHFSSGIQFNSLEGQSLETNLPIMGNEKLWWTWGMADRGTIVNSSLLLYSTDDIWNVTINQDIYNHTANITWQTDGSPSNSTTTFDQELIISIVIGAVLCLLILITIIGNLFVISAIIIERHLQSVANYLILSLAVADLLVACLVMPLGAVYVVSEKWNLGTELCDIWTSTDVLCCTASILHLVAIALDRYWAVTNIDYMNQRTAKRIGLMIAVVWMVSIAVCIAPLLGWKDESWEKRVIIDKNCLVSQDIGYQIFATVSSFYLPLLVILILYWRIFQTARKRIRKRPGQTVSKGPTKTMDGPSRPLEAGHAVGDALVRAQMSGGIAAVVVAVVGQPLPTISETTTAFTTVSSTNTSPEKTSYHNGLEPDPPTMDASPKPVISRKKKIAADSKKERKAAKTLAIITGSFIACWLPFFIIAILLPICEQCEIPEYLIAFFQWLGYFNSTLNPVIYTIFSPEFRNAFKKLLCRRRRGVGRRMGVRHYM